MQVDGKVRDRVDVAADITEADLERTARELPGVKRSIGDRTVRHVVVRARLVSLVTG